MAQKRHAVHHSSEDQCWETPDDVLELVREMGPIVLDPCTSAANPTGATWYASLPVVDGLAVPWAEVAAGGLIYVNPPYGREVGHWMRKCAEEARAGAEIIALPAARTDTRWFHEYCRPRQTSDALCLVEGRIRFRGAPNAAPFPSVFVYWGPRPERFAQVFSRRGLIVLR